METVSSQGWKKNDSRHHFDEADGRCWPGARKRTFSIPRYRRPRTHSPFSRLIPPFFRAAKRAREKTVRVVRSEAPGIATRERP